MKFDDSYFVDVEFLPLHQPISRQGGPQLDYAGQTGTTIKAAPYDRILLRLDSGGVVTSGTMLDFFLRDDPAALNGGNGIQVDDAIRFAGRIYRVECLVADASAVPGLFPLWTVSTRLFA